MMAGENLAERVGAVRRLLHTAGLSGATVEAAGHESEIAAVVAPASELARLRALAPAVKALGFRYVALELGAVGAGQPPSPRPVDEPSRELP
ncbi:MAG: hypothetical protein P8Z36_13150 [Gemmatimonadota bacterium]|jgi:hypothetical protein